MTYVRPIPDMVSNDTYRGEAENLPSDPEKPVRGKPFEPGNQAALGHKIYSPKEMQEHIGECLDQFQHGQTLWQVEQWGRGEKQWSAAHTRTVMDKARKLLLQVSRETAEEARARLLALCERLIPDCERYVLGTAPIYGEGGGGGSIVMEDPKTGAPMKHREHKAIQGYLGLIAKLHGLDKTVIEHRGLSNKRPSELSNEELDTQLEVLEAEIAQRATPAEAVEVQP